MITLNELNSLGESVKYSLSDYINYLDFIDNKIFFENEACAVVLQLQSIYDEMLSDQELMELKEKLINFLNSLENDISIQFYFKKHKYFDDLKKSHLQLNESENELIKELFKKRIDKLEDDINNDLIFRYPLYLIIRKNYKYDISNVQSLVYSPKKLRDSAKKRFLNILHDLDEIQEKYIYYLNKAGFLVRKPEEQEVIDLVTSHINQTILKNIHFTHKDDLIISDLRKTYDYLYINGKYFRIITLKNEPEYVYPTLIKYLTRADLNFEYDIIVNLQILDKYKETLNLKRQKKVTRALKFDLIGDDVDEEKQAKEDNISSLLADMVSGKENLFKFELLILVKGNSLKELNQNCDDMLSSIRQLEGAQGFLESIANFKLFMSTMPGNFKFDNFRDFKFRTSYVVDLLPIYGPPVGIGEPLMLFRNKYNSITYLNPLSNKFINKNGIIIGSSGSGKSFLMNNISLSYLGFDPIILIVDKGGSYKKFIETLGGDYFEISPEYSINPFFVLSDNRSLFWKSIIEVMVREEDKAISNDEKIVIEEAVSLVENKGISKPTISDFVSAINSLSFNSEELRRIQDRLCRHLSRWTKGVYGQFLNNAESNLDVSNNILGFDLKGLENYPEILEVFMFYISSVSWYKAELDRKRRKLFIFDEVWHMFLTEQGGQLLMEMYRTLRKYGASIFSISQDVSDFADSKYSPAIMQNISFFYILKQSDGTNYEKLQKTLNLTDQDIVEIKDLTSSKGNYSEMFAKVPGLSFIARVVPSPFEYWISTTDSEDVSVYNDTLKEFNFDVLKTLLYLSEKHPNGVFN